MGHFAEVFKELNLKKVKYLVGGGVAVNLYGFARFTGDIDILLLLENENLSKMYKVIEKLKYIERLPVSIMSLVDKTKVKKWLEEALAFGTAFKSGKKPTPKLKNLPHGKN